MNTADPDNLLQVTLASIGDGVIATDPEGCVTFLNTVAEHLTGWTSQQASGQPLAKVFHILNEYTRERVENPVDKVLRLGQVVGLANHTVLIAKDGCERPIDDSAAPIRGADGHLRGVVLVFRDITERKQAENAAAERHQIMALRANLGVALAIPRPLRESLQASCDALVRQLNMLFARVWTLDEAEEVLELNASAGRYTHLDGPHSRVRVGEFKIGRIAANRQPHLTNDVPNDPNVSDQAWAVRERMIAFAGYPLLVEGRVLGVLAMFACHPLSEILLEDLAPVADQIAQLIDRKRSEERLRSSELRYRLVGHVANDAIWDWDLQTNRVVWNEGVQARFGYRADQVGVLADWWVGNIHTAEQDRVVHGIHSAIESGQNWQEQYRFRRADGSYATVFDRGQVVYDDGGKPIRMVGSMLDMTERMRAERLIAESEERLRRALDSTDLGAWNIDPETNTLVSDERFRLIFHGSTDPIAYEQAFAIILLEDRLRVREAIAAAMRPVDPAPYAEEYRVVHPNGAIRWLLAKGRSNFETGPTGRRLTSFDGTVLDITVRKQAEDALRYQQDLTKSITDNATTAIFMMDAKSRCTFINPAAEAMTGFSFAELDGGILHDFIHHHRSDGSDYPIAECPLDRALPQHIEVRNHEDLFFRKNGESFPVTCNARVIYEDGKAVGTVIEVRDTTVERRTAETIQNRSDQLHRLAEVATRIGVAHDVGSVVGIVTQEVRNVIEAHQAVASMTVDQNWGQAITAVSLSEKYDNWKSHDVPPDGSGIYSVVCRTNRPMRFSQAELEAHPAWNPFGSESGNHPPMRGWLAAPLVGRDGQNLGLIQLSDKLEGDFTEDDEAVLVQLAQMASVAIENARLFENLQNADRRKDEFLATLAHELRNPLAPIRMGLEVLRLGGNDAEETEEIRGMMERQTQQLITLVDDLLDVSRITQGKLELRKCEVALSDIVRSAVEASRPFIDEAGHRLTVAVPDLPLNLKADPNRLAQVISNLLNNAAKYTPDGGQIRLAVERQGNEVVISVHDNGVGIPAEMQRRVFEMFAQIDRPMEKGYMGLGIGLTLVRSLVEMHDGRVEVESAGSNLGSTFRVRLPATVESSEHERRHAQSPIETARAPRRVLVVDDNKAAATMLSMVIKMLGHEVRIAGDGREAIETAAEYLPDVVLMDIGMPRLNGYQAAQHMRQQTWGQRMLLVALTGWGQDEDRQRTKEAGFDHHLVKPAEPGELQKLLAEHPTSSNGFVVE